MAKDKKVTCGTCLVIFADNDTYLKHQCEITGYKPTSSKHFGRKFLMQSKAALKRGNSLTKTREEQLDIEIANSKEEETDSKIALARIENKKKK